MVCDEVIENVMVYVNNNYERGIECRGVDNFFDVEELSTFTCTHLLSRVHAMCIANSMAFLKTLSP